jgi:HrpA-like RNA helicase
MLSAENVLYMPSPHGSPDAQEQRAKAIAAHKALAAYEGDVPTLLHIYERWVAAKKSKSWCWDHFINARAMEKAHEVREQLVTLTQRLGLDPTSTCGNEKQIFLRCLAASLFLNIAKRQASSLGTTSNNGGNGGSGRGCYKTLQTGKEVAIHPSSVLHGRNPPPPYLVYTEVLTTTRTYIRGVTMADATALQELVPQFFGGGGNSGNGGGKG